MTSLAQVNLITFFKECFFRTTLWFFSFLLITGNFPRFLNLTNFKDNLLISELFLYFFCAISYFLLGKIWNLRLLLFAMLIFFSTLQGAYLFGPNLKGLVFAVRLIAMVVSGWVVGQILFRRYRDDLPGFCLYWIRLYTLCCFLGLVVYLVFPSSTQFWIFLRRFGITFYGDPHQGRFLSPYFDPNFFSSIAIIPFIFSWLYNRMDPVRKWRYAYLLFLTCSLLAWSRSGVATLICMFLYIGWDKLKVSLHFRRQSLWIFFSLSAFLLAVSIILFPTMRFFFYRLLYAYQDESALYRLQSFGMGLKFFSDYPLGLGYNYLSVLMMKYTLMTSVDSSLLSTLVNFGAILTAIFVILYIFFSIQQYVRFKRVKDLDPHLFRLFRFFLVYLNVIVIFTCQFNNILFYQFWLLPMIAIFQYLQLYRNRIIQLTL